MPPVLEAEPPQDNNTSDGKPEALRYVLRQSRDLFTSKEKLVILVLLAPII